MTTGMRVVSVRRIVLLPPKNQPLDPRIDVDTNGNDDDTVSGDDGIP